MSETCATCRFWRDLADEPGLGHCRIRAPVAQVVMPDDVPHPGIAWWPATHPSDWCGEHQPREVETEQPKVREPGWYWVKKKPT